MSRTMRDRLMELCASGNPEHVARLREVLAGVEVSFEGRGRGFCSLTEVIANGVAVSDEMQHRGASRRDGKE